MNTTMTFKNRPSVLSTTRSIVISDARMYSLVDDNFRDFPVEVIRHGIRATQNVAQKNSGANETSQSSETKDVRNLQLTDTAKVHPQAECLVVETSLSFTNIQEGIELAGSKKDDDPDTLTAFRQSIDHFIDRFKQSKSISELSNRYARNLLNGRWLFRNRVSAERIEIVVTQGDKELCRVANALDIPLMDFDSPTHEEITVAREIRAGLLGERPKPFVVTAYVYLLAKGAVEVYPSQNYIENKPKGFARSLYVYLPRPVRRDATEPQVIGYAALRDAKVVNAIRTIDTWYESDDPKPTPIPVEPNGASLTYLKFFRPSKTSAFELVKKLNALDIESDDAKFVAACFLVRGGVYPNGKEAS